MNLLVFRILLGLSLFTEVLCTESGIGPHNADEYKYLILDYSVGTFKFWALRPYFKPLESAKRKSFSVDLNQPRNTFVLIALLDDNQQYYPAIGNVDDNSDPKMKDLLRIRRNNGVPSVSKPARMKSHDSYLHKIVYNPNDLDVKFPLMRGKKWVNIKMKGKKEGFRLYYSGRVDLTFQRLLIKPAPMNDNLQVSRMKQKVTIPLFYKNNEERKLTISCRGVNKKEEPLLSLIEDSSDLPPTYQLCPMDKGMWELYKLSISYSDNFGSSKPPDESCVGVVLPMLRDSTEPKSHLPRANVHCATKKQVKNGDDENELYQYNIQLTVDHRPWRPSNDKDTEG